MTTTTATHYIIYTRMTPTRIAIETNGISLHLYVEDNPNSYGLPLQATIHAYNPFREERVARIFARTTKELTSRAEVVARRAFNILG